MKRTPITQSAFFNLSTLFALTLSAIGCFLALAALGVVRIPFSESRLDPLTQSADATSGSQRPNSAAVPSKKKVVARGSASKTVSGAAAPTASGSLAQTSTSNLQHSKVKGQSNQS